MNVIYVEDNENNQRLLERMLNKRGIEVEIRDTPESGLEAVLTQKPDMVFVDVHLKTRHTGLDLVAWLRERGVQTPIIVVTCFNMMADRRRALEAGCNGYLSKPFSMQELFELVDTFSPAGV